MMDDLLKYVIITSFKVDASDESEADRKKTFFPGQKWRPAVFTNIPRAQGSVDPDMDESVGDIAMRTSAAPTYFPLHQGYADGVFLPLSLSLSLSLCFFKSNQN